MSDTDKTLNDLLGEKNDFEFSDDDGNETNSLSSQLRSSKDKTNSVETSSINLKDDEKTKNFSAMTKLFSQLENSLNNIKNLPELKLIDKYSQDMKKKLDRHLEELDFIMMETKATIINTQRHKKQLYYVKKELAHMVKNLNKVKQEEIQEMELVVAVYDKDLLRRWHVAKKTTSPHALEGFINNIVGKRQAVDNVYRMAKDRLEVLKKSGNVSSLPALADKILTQIGITEKDEDTP